MTKINAIGLMSGTSLDGLDITYCEFLFENNNWNYKIVATKTISFSSDLKVKLSNASKLSGLELMKIDKSFGEFSAKSVNDFIEDNSLNKSKIDLIASHGHTIFHQPDLHFSTQIGCGATINAITRIKTICDFRSTDTALYGQGAPLVPIGDELLFSKYDACLNLGGIANISFTKNEERTAFDVCFANLPLNYICRKHFNSEYDKNGDFGKQGKIDSTLLHKLESLDFYSKKQPKSLGREDFENNILPFLMDINPKDILKTFYVHFTDIIAKELNDFKTVLITGGGAFNTYFIDLLQTKTSCEIIIPDNQLVEYKESLIFAFLGSLNHIRKTNILKQVTGAKSDTISGAIYNAFEGL